MKNINNIKIAMMELFDKSQKGEIKERVAVYFIEHLDAITTEPNELLKPYSKARILPNKNIADVIEYLAPEIIFEDDRKGKFYLNEEKQAENAREILFMKDGKNYIYLGSVIDLDEDLTKEIYINIAKACETPSLYRQVHNDKALFDSLDKKYIDKYQKFIEKNLRCLSAIVNKDKDKTYTNLLNELIKKLEKRNLTHRIQIIENLKIDGVPSQNEQK